MQEVQRVRLYQTHSMPHLRLHTCVFYADLCSLGHQSQNSSTSILNKGRMHPTIPRQITQCLEATFEAMQDPQTEL